MTGLEPATAGVAGRSTLQLLSLQLLVDKNLRLAVEKK
jgi:hypothetical protein